MTPRYGHTCHWPGCNVDVAPKLFMCKSHWLTLPPEHRKEIWRTYRPGQENDKQPSEAYLSAAKRALEWAEKLQRLDPVPVTSGGPSSPPRGGSNAN